MKSNTEPLLPPAQSRADAIARRKLLIGTGLCFAFMLCEIAGGLVAHSLAIITDAAHMLSDVAGFLVSVLALFMSSRTADARYSFGFHRAEVLGALASIMVVWVMTAALLYSAVLRLITPEEVDGAVMFWISVIGVLMNIVLIKVLGHGDVDGGLAGHQNFGCGHDHSHGGGHDHGHGGHDKPKPKPKYVPPKPPAHGHDHHGHDEHDHADHADCGHDHGHGGEANPKKAAHRHGHDEHGHGHGGDDHGHGGEARGHDEHGDCCGHDHGGELHGHAEHGHAEHGGCEHGHEHEAHHNGGESGGGVGGVFGQLTSTMNDERNLAVRAAMAHVIGDILQSLGVCVAAALIWAFSDRWLDENGISYWYRADPICTFLFSILVIWSTMHTVREAVHILMEGVPLGTDSAELVRQLEAIPNVLGVHDVHLWTLVGDKMNVWAHVTVAAGSDSTAVLYACQRVAKETVNCHHACFQLEDAASYDRAVEGASCFEDSHA